MTNPYAGAADYQMWRRAVSRVPPFRIDPGLHPRFSITREMKVATAGSCFAQHISRRLARLGFNYFVPEDGAGLDDAARSAGQYGVFSARYGNLYTVHQLHQLFQEAMGDRRPRETAWARPDGRFVDPFRPMVEPAGHADEAAVAAARADHLAHVRRIFTEADVFVFTLGLTEGWRSRLDGSVYPLAPGVAAGAFDPEAHEFHNFTMAEVRDTLTAFVADLRAVNPGVRVLLTVSPVPLIATYEDRHVIVSTTYSKSVLRVAAQEVIDAHDFVDYFPSYEIITTPATGGLYFEEDQREVNAQGVDHAMRSFLAAYTGTGARGPAASAPLTEAERKRYSAATGIVCDEEAIDRA